MKTYQEIPTYPILRRQFKTAAELGEVINRSSSYVLNCLNGRSRFTDHEKKLLLVSLGEPITEESIRRYFMEK